MKRRLHFWLNLVLSLALLEAGSLGTATASVQVSQTPLDPVYIPKYVTELPYFNSPALGNLRIDGTKPLTVTYQEFQQEILPHNFYLSLAAPFNRGTYVWGYRISDGTKNVLNYPATTIVSQEGVPTLVKYINALPNPPVLQQYITVDQTLHWADPFNLDMMDPARKDPYAGPIPVVPHLHGAITSSAFDGGPDAWFTNALPPGGSQHGPGYRTLAGAKANEAVYWYINNQEPTTLWFHEHTLGATRLNVYAGLAGYYFLRGPMETAVKGGLPSGQQEVEFVIQDRQFDTNGQLLFPDGTNPPPPDVVDIPPNPDVHPFWIPEFFGNVIVVNGASWPKFTARPQRYRFRLLNGSNARFYNLKFSNEMAFYVIGTDGGLLDDPVPVTSLLVAPGERYDIIIDFTHVIGHTFTMINDANAPYPDGDPADPNTTGQICQFVVGNTPVNDTSYDPTHPGLKKLRRGNDQIVRLPGTPGGPAISATNNVKRYRQLTLNEVSSDNGPLEILINNSKWSGLRGDHMTAITDSSAFTLSSNSSNDTTDYLTELPQNSTTEVWEIINLTMDAHPIHIHEFQFQLINRQNYDTAYVAAYVAAFPENTFIPAYGPPLPYNTNQTPGNPLPTIGGNPDVTLFLQGAPMPPLLQEQGWKDTFIMFPGQVTRVAVRWTPQNIKVGKETPGVNMFVGFDPTKVGNPPNGIVTKNGDGGPGYVWHCHIIDHEDNEMMRPYFPVTNANNSFSQP